MPAVIALVTGGCGFVGAHIAAALAGSGDVIAADVQPWDAAVERALATLRERLTYAPLDVRDRDALHALITDRQVTHIVHAAAVTAPDTAANAPLVVGVNLSGAIHVLDLALEAPSVERVLTVSSSGVYGAQPSTHTQREDDPLVLNSLYSITKVSTERLAARYAELSGKPMASVRLPAVYGPWERSRASRPHTSTLRRLMDALAAGQPIRVAGPDIANDWTYAPEIGAGVRALLLAPQWSHAVYNLSTGVPVTFRAAVDTFAARGLRATWVDEPADADIAMRPEQARAPLATARLEQDAGFRPTLTLPAALDLWLRAEPHE